jgi:hypothetical protein
MYIASDNLIIFKKERKKTSFVLLIYIWPRQSNNINNKKDSYDESMTNVLLLQNEISSS